jgi:mannitol/fructose-specific phosphotransferase system IIA component (Ntr-type)
MMDNVEISVHRTGKTICFESAPDEAALVIGVWHDVIGQMRSMSEELAQPVRQDKIYDFIQSNAERKDDTVQRVSKNQLRDYMMLPSLTASTKQEAIEKIVDAIAANDPKAISDVEEVKRLLLAREQAMSSGLDHGIAVPHCKTNAVNRIVGAVAIVSNNGSSQTTIADYETFDHTQVKVIVLTIVPNAEHAPYLQLMASLSRMLRVSSEYQRLLTCTSAESMMAFFSSKQGGKAQ